MSLVVIPKQMKTVRRTKPTPRVRDHSCFILSGVRPYVGCSLTVMPPTASRILPTLISLLSLWLCDPVVHKWLTCVNEGVRWGSIGLACMAIITLPVSIYGPRLLEVRTRTRLKNWVL
jgi:hypothetical protein